MILAMLARRACLPVLWALVGLASHAMAAPGLPPGDEGRLEGGLTAVESTPSAGVRRWEYVILLRTVPEAHDALGRAQVAALKAGGAVLDDLRMESTASHSDYRVLVRTRDPDTVHRVVNAMRTTRGVLGATATPLPETPTYAGGPGFFESYSGGDDRPSNANRIVMHHDVPPIADKKELLEMADVLAPPSAGPDGAGGLTLNVSELFSRIKEGAWRRREEKLRNTPIEILPPATAASGP
jgi:hypothetical protein